MARKATTAGLKKKAHELLQRLVRMKAADDCGIVRCVSCGKLDHYKAMDGGHFISRTYTYHSLREENIHPQCKRCNRFFGLCHDDYRVYMVDMYGADYVEWLSTSKRNICKRSRMDYEDMIEDFKTRLKEQENRLAGA